MLKNCIKFKDNLVMKENESQGLHLANISTRS